MENDQSLNTPISQPTIQEAKSGNSSPLIIITVVVVILMVVAGVYWYMTNKNNNNPQAQASVQQTADNADSELNGLDMGNTDTDLSDIDKDLQSL